MQQVSTYPLPILLVSVISAFLVIYGWIKRNSPMGKSYVMMMLVITLWLILYSVGLLAIDAPNIYVYLKHAEYLTILSLPVAWLVFALNFAGIKNWLSSKTGFWIGVIPVLLFVVSLLTKNSSGLHVEHNKSLIYDSTINFWLYLHIAFSFAYFIIGTILVITSARKDPLIGVKQSFIIGMGVLVPWIGNITFIFRIVPDILDIDLSPFIFVLSGALLAWGLFYNRFFGIIAIAHKSLIERMTDGLVIVDNQNRVLDINLAAQSIFRVSRAKIIGQAIDELFKKQTALMQYMNYTSRKNQELVITYGQQKKYYSLDISTIYAGQEIFVAKLLLFKEITNLKETTKKWERAKNQAEQADSLKSAFLANLSHEIKTPMNAIMGFSDLLNDASVSDEERKEFIDHIRNSGSDLLQLMDDLIDISKLDANQINLQKSPVDLSKMMAELFARVNESMIEADKGHIDLILDTHDLEQDLMILSDPDRIRQILNNLLNNAVKFTKQGKIEFGYKEDNSNTVTFFVKDTGIGIPLAKHAVIFDRFRRVSSSNSQEYSGTGLGLSLSRALVKLFGGRIWFDSIFGKGSSFYFSIPLIKSDNYHAPVKPLDTVKIVRPEPVPEPVSDPIPELPVEAVNESEKSEDRIESIQDHIEDMPKEAGVIFEADQAPTITMQEETDFSDAKLLIIEFEDMSYLFIEMILRPTNIQIIRAKSLNQGLNLLKGGTKLTGIILSSDIPDENLIDACLLLKEKHPRHKVVAITPFASETKRQECLRAGCTNVLPKPLKQKELLAAVQNMYKLSKI